MTAPNTMPNDRPAASTAPNRRHRRSLRALARRLRKDQRGSPLLEFLLVLPVMVLLTLGAIEMSFVYITYSSMMDAAREATRQLARGSVDADGAEALALARLQMNRPFVIAASDPAPSSADDVAVTITLPVADATATQTLPFQTPNIEVTVTMRKEA